ncbi:excinuclease ABC subunit C [Pleurocapsa sp. CCALA 161]|uniref:ATP-binding protein n=1 Tax=Pleurocapsa sp. CCALA 161 TaxID=2107688 RepID=UPI000D066224|nr:GIY-YIG nuclease family protein [Pleurocapsa sp. CCALA 161]PSB07708.1 excinuclease ABC subunit C [Pleurocapsa sp. CCALA 161]
MFARKEKPLPIAVLKPEPTTNTQQTEGEGIHLGEGYYWNPETLPNGHIVAIGASGSGKTQTLKAIAFSLHQTYPQMQVILLDFHGDQEIIGETCYPIHMASPHGINPLVVNLDPEGGGSNLQAIQMAGILKKSLRLGPNQEGMLIEVIKTCYLKRGIVQEQRSTWNLEPPNFDDLEEELNRRVATAFQDDSKKELAESICIENLPVGKPNTSGIYFIFHQSVGANGETVAVGGFPDISKLSNPKGNSPLLYIGAARDIQKRIDGHHHIRYLLKEHYPGETFQIRYYEHLSDWQELIKLENYLIQIHRPSLNQTTLRTECKDSQKLKLKLAATFQYGVFSRPQPKLTEKLIRIDLSKLPPELAAISAESLAWQLMNQHRLLGEIQGRLPRTFLFIDEAKEMPKNEGSACDRIIADGRKFGLSLVLASQSERHLSQDVIGNSASKIVLPVDQTEVNKVAKKFRFAEKKVAELTSLTALCRFGKEAELLEILPYYQRLKDVE